MGAGDSNFSCSENFRDYPWILRDCRFRGYKNNLVNNQICTYRITNNKGRLCFISTYSITRQNKRTPKFLPFSGGILLRLFQGDLEFLAAKFTKYWISFSFVQPHKIWSSYDTIVFLFVIKLWNNFFQESYLVRYKTLFSTYFYQ